MNNKVDDRCSSVKFNHIFLFLFHWTSTFMDHISCFCYCVCTLDDAKRNTTYEMNYPPFSLADWSFVCVLVGMTKKRRKHKIVEDVCCQLYCCCCWWWWWWWLFVMLFLFLSLTIESNINSYNNKQISYHYNSNKSFVNYVVGVVINPWINPEVLFFFDNFYRRNLSTFAVAVFILLLSLSLPLALLLLCHHHHRRLFFVFLIIVPFITSLSVECLLRSWSRSRSRSNISIPLKGIHTPSPLCRSRCD